VGVAHGLGLAGDTGAGCFVEALSLTQREGDVAVELGVSYACEPSAMSIWHDMSRDIDIDFRSAYLSRPCPRT
jgi:hypothetical protein